MGNQFFTHRKLSNFEFVWLGVIFWATTISAVESTYFFTFKSAITKWQIYLDLAISIFFMADFINRFIYKFINKPKKHFKRTRDSINSIQDNYLLSAAEIISCIPFDIILTSFTLNPAFSILRLFKLIRMIKIFNILEVISTFPKKIRLQMIIIAALVVIHWIACAWILLNPSTVIKSDNLTTYNKAFYWSVTTLTTIGYGDITPTNNLSRLFTMVIMLCGVGVYGLIIGNISGIFAESARYKERAREKMTDLTLFMKHYHIPDRLQGATFSYYQHIMSKRLTENDSKIISDLPQSIRDELQIYMNMKLIKTLDIFQNTSISCLKEVSAALEQKSFTPGQSIIRIGELGEEMYIIAHGSVQIINKDGKEVATLHSGQFFGEIALLEEKTRNADVRASSYSDLYKLKKSDFLNIINHHEELLKNVVEKTSSKNNLKIKKAA